MNYQAYQGKLNYSSDLEAGAHQLLVAVPCRIGNLTDRIHALLDTGSVWCVLPPPLAEALGYEVAEGGVYRLHTRLGTFAGELVREEVIFSPADDQVSTNAPDRVAVDATIAQKWPIPSDFLDLVHIDLDA